MRKLVLLFFNDSGNEIPQPALFQSPPDSNVSQGRAVYTSFVVFVNFIMKTRIKECVFVVTVGTRNLLIITIFKSS